MMQPISFFIATKSDWKKHPVPSNLTLSPPNPFGIYLCTGGADLDTLELWPSEDVFNFLGSPRPFPMPTGLTKLVDITIHQKFMTLK